MSPPDIAPYRAPYDTAITPCGRHSRTPGLGARCDDTAFACERRSGARLSPKHDDVVRRLDPSCKTCD
jgi:hypothetical protein